MPQPLALAAQDLGIAAAPRLERILMAVKHHELAMFLPDMDGRPGDIDLQTFRHETLEDEMDSLAWEALLRDFQPTVLLSCWHTPPLPARWITDANCSLRYVCHLAGTVRQLVPREFLERGGLVSNWGGLAGETVAEHALLLALASLRRQPQWESIIGGPNPVPYVSPMLRLRTRTLRRRRIGVHGFGHVARALIDLLGPFAADIAVFSKGVPDGLIREAGARPAASLRELAAHSEVFFECEALTPQTDGCIDAAVLAAFPKDAVFVNVARGALVNEDALQKTAYAGHIRIALDVVRKDPISADSIFHDLPDAVLSPHIAGPTADLFPHCGRQALDNLNCYLNGTPLLTAVGLEQYDRAT